MSAKYGDILKEARERQRISIREISRELHVREDIVVSLEDGDFSKIPPQGYSRNMIKSYARILGLNAREITDMFLDAEYSYQIGKKRASVQNMVEENRRRVPDGNYRFKGTRTPREQIEHQKQQKFNNLQASDEAENSGRRSSPFSNRRVQKFGVEYKNSPRSRRESDKASYPSKGINDHTYNTMSDLAEGDNYASAKSRLQSRLNNKNIDNRADKTNKTNNQNSYTERFKRSEVRPDLNDSINPNQRPVSNRVNFQDMHIYKSGNQPKMPQNINIFLIGGLVVVLIIVLIIVMFFAGRQINNSKMDMSDINVTGLTDPEKSVSQNSDNSSNQSDTSQTQTQTTEPTKAVFTYKVTGSTPVYMEITVDGKKEVARDVASGSTDNFDVTGVLKFVTSKPEGVTISVDGATVTPVDENKMGVYVYTVDFQKILKDWKAKNNKS